MTGTSSTITIERDRLYPLGGNYRQAWRWTYSYAIDGAPPVEYGTGLASCRSMLRRRYPAARIVLGWER